MTAAASRVDRAPPGNAPLRCLLFDLDGTLADTAPDLAHALNLLRAEHRMPSLPFETIRPFVSHGATALIKLGFTAQPDTEEFAALRERFLAIYRDCLSVHTRLFPGIADLLDALEGRGIKWGIVTNKPSWLTEPLVADLGLRTRAACVVSGDTTENRKPHPEPMLHACQACGVTARECLYVGDARRDIEAGRNAGMRTLIALFGYLGEADDPAEWAADGMVAEPHDILSWLDIPRTSDS